MAAKRGDEGKAAGTTRAEVPGEVQPLVGQEYPIAVAVKSAATFTRRATRAENDRPACNPMKKKISRTGKSRS